MIYVRDLFILFSIIMATMVNFTLLCDVHATISNKHLFPTVAMLLWSLLGFSICMFYCLPVQLPSLAVVQH